MTLTNPPPLSAAVERRHSRDADQVVAQLEAVFHRASDFTFYGSPGKHRYSHVRLSLGELTMARYDHSGFRFRATSGDNFHLALFTRGGARVKTRNGEMCASPFVSGHTLPPNQRFFLDVHPGSVVYTLEFPMTALSRKVQALMGNSAPADALDAEVDLQSGPGVALVRNVLSTFNELETLATVGLSSLAVAGFSDLLTNLALAAALPSLRAELGEWPASAASRSVEQARLRLAARAHEPIRISDVAAEMNVGVRALQAAFQRHVGCSPLQYLLRCRVELARARLLSPGPMDTVSSIALDCGFKSSATFALRYRRVFGELPSATLSRSRR